MASIAVTAMGLPILEDRSMPRTGQPAARHIASVQRAITLLDVLAEAGTELGTNELARRTGINPSTVSRLLATLVSGGLIDHVPDTGRYRLGLRLLQLGTATLAGLGVRDLARPHLAELAELSGETATLSVPGDGEAVTLDYVPSPLSVRSEARVGRTSAAHATSVGKVFLAYGGSLPPGDLVAYTARTVTDRDALAAEVERTRWRGWAEARGEREEHLNAVAAPVLDGAAQLVAILGVQGPATRFTPRRMRAVVAPLRERAAALGHR
jgi:DNA-binding IclR family transcriptional regulator